MDLGQLYSYTTKDIETAINSPKQIIVAAENFENIYNTVDSQVVKDIASATYVERLMEFGIDEESATMMAQAYDKNSLSVGQIGGIINSEGVKESKNTSLTFEEESALLDYKSSESYKINSMLRDGDVLTDEEMQFVEKLDVALQKMPTYEGIVYRNLVFDDFGGEQAYNEFLNEHQVGNVIPYKAYIPLQQRWTVTL